MTDSILEPPIDVDLGEDDMVEDSLEDESSWEAGFQRGVQLADDEMVSEWDEEDEFA